MRATQPYRCRPEWSIMNLRVDPGILRHIELQRDKVEDWQVFPFNVPAVKHLERLEFDPSVTFLVGENGSGKSTLIEAIAIKAGFLAAAEQYGNALLAESRIVSGVPTKSVFGTYDATALVGDLLRPRGQRAYAKHHGHTTLGLVALRTDDVPAALAHLRASAAVDTDARLSSYGPSFALARELCLRSARDEVREYLVACRRFWKEPIVDEWLAELSEGRTPNFK